MSLENRWLALIEDDPIMGESLVQRLELEGATVSWWHSIDEARQGLRDTAAEAVICDIRLPDGTGEDLFRESWRSGRTRPFLFVTAYGDVAQAVRLMREGAHDYVTKPFEMDDFLDRLSQMLKPDSSDAEPALGVSKAMRDADVFLMRASRMASPLLITGETGVGKEVVTRRLHSLRDVPAGPFMAVNCAALPPDLMESELFGHERGAFTGAQSQHLGYAERAGNGMLFLDEIGDLALKLQAKLLRLIEDRNFHRVGGEKLIPFKARIVCATNADLRKNVAAGTFREDLYYRINVLALRVPPLRERPADIAWLMDRFYAELVAGTDTGARGFSAAAYDVASTYEWPGNARELRNRIERALAFTASHWILPHDLFPEQQTNEGGNAPASHTTLASVRDDAERRQIVRVLAAHDGHIANTAEALGVSRTTLWEKMKRHAIS